MIRSKKKKKGVQGKTGITKIELNRRYKIVDANGRPKKVTILRRAGKATSKKWNTCYNIRENDTEEVKWTNLNTYSKIGKIEDNSSVYLGFDDPDLMYAKCKELNNWKINKVYDPVKFVRQKWATLNG